MAATLGAGRPRRSSPRSRDPASSPDRITCAPMAQTTDSSSTGTWEVANRDGDPTVSGPTTAHCGAGSHDAAWPTRASATGIGSSGAAT